MKFSLIDYLIVVIYLIGTVAAGFLTSKKQKNSRDYFLGGKELKWWAVGFSIVASETSTLTFISIPGLAYKSDMTFMQLIFGYFIGRIIVSLVFIPAYYKGNIETAYDFLGKRFGQKLRKLTSSVFIVTRVLASGVRLFATAIPVHIITGLDYPASIAIIGIFTLLYTYMGGLKAVVTMDVIQMFIYIGGAVAALYVIMNGLPNGFNDVLYYAHLNGLNKFTILNFNFGNSFMEFLSSPYTIIGGLLGGTFLTMASHGTDQLLVQRLLGCKTKKESQKALMLDATLIVVQFAFFLFLGLCLFAFYKGVSFNTLVLNSTGLNLTSSDEIFPKFIVENLPSGISGFVIAGILASAMGTLSSAISSLASSTYLDLFHSVKSRKFRDKEIFWSRIFTLIWGVVLIGGAMLFRDARNPVVEIGLSIASFTYGGLLGVFFLGLFFKKVNETDAIIGFIAGILVMVFIIYYTKVAYTWYVITGVSVTLIAANLVFFFRFLKSKNS
ncbi:MAG: sodium:solute symporter [Ignavibacteria bacterium]|nr:sodium:solute symporter [Ignavibacteria bacterium]